jgi:hypothetical protein
MFNITAVSRTGATSKGDCLASFVQIQDVAWYLPVSSSDGVTTSPAGSFVECVDRCTAPDCQFVTFDYATNVCSVRVAVAPTSVG